MGEGFQQFRNISDSSNNGADRSPAEGDAGGLHLVPVDDRPVCLDFGVCPLRK